MIKKIVVIVFLFVFIGIGIKFIAGNNDETTSERKIGVVVPLTGAGSNFGVHYLNGMNLAVEEINREGGIKDKGLKIYPQDTKLDNSKVSVDAVRYLLNIVRPDVFVSVFHPSTATISPILKEAKKPLMYEAYTRSPEQDNPYAFKSHFDSLTGCKLLVQYAQEHKRYRKLGAVMSQIEFNDLCLEGMRKIDNSVIEYRYPIGEKDFKTLLAKASRDGI